MLPLEQDLKSSTFRCSIFEPVDSMAFRNYCQEPRYSVNHAELLVDFRCPASDSLTAPEMSVLVGWYACTGT